MRRRFLLLGAAALAGCSSPQPQYYRLAPLAGAVRGGTGTKIGVRSVGVPDSATPQSLPKPGGPYDADGFANDLWAAPLAGMLQAAMVQNLAQRLPGDVVIASGGAIGAAPDVYVEINVLVLSPDASGNMVLRAQLATRPATAADFDVQNFAASVPGATTPEGIAAAVSTLWGQAADAVAGMI